MAPQNQLTETACSLPSCKITRKQLAAYCGLSLRTIDELTRNGVLPHFKIGKSIRYDFAEVEAAFRDRFHVQPKARKVANKGTRSQS
ncbi:MAG: helix-turn-helix domain-containing protein [Verrucomicrobiota bacterium]|nr:helix-turn-helix domain-containing protein [Verrucomicrobiota bacterium]